MVWVDMLRREAVRWAGRGLDLLCPPRCAFCAADIPEADRTATETVCPPCRRQLLADPPRCGRCGRSRPVGTDCDRCRGGRDWDGIAVLGGYADEWRAAVLRAKRPSGEPVAAALGHLLASKHADTFAAWRIDVVAPVPMHWMRRSVRGTSAADEIARSLAARLRLPCRPLLQRWRATAMQNELPFEERRGNVRAAFRAGRGVRGARVLLVDDVVTTGGTLAECRRVLGAAGATAIFATAVARAERSEDGGADDA